MVNKLTYEYVKSQFEKQQCKLLETKYVNNSTKMKYICKCQNEAYITWGHFQRGQRCIKCSGREKLTLKYVRKFFKEQDCELLEKVYTNSNTKMKYLCKCGNESFISFDNFRSGYRCKRCGGTEKLTIEFVSNYFTEQNCKLLETEYINSNTKMKYLCQCNNESSITWDNFKQGYRCVMCGYDKQELSKKLFKQYKFPSGSIRNIQGYENIALDELVKKFKEHNIITKRTEMPKIMYKLKDKEHRYYPDIWIKSINKIIEVKSCYTYRKELIKNINKALATRKLKFDFECWIYTHNSKNIYNKVII
jgi:hypothetical protein